jgi:hypothetical protein
VNLEKARKLARVCGDRAGYWKYHRRTSAAADEYSVDVVGLSQHIVELADEVERLRSYLGQYADKDNWYEDTVEGDSWWAGGRGWDLATEAMVTPREEEA